MNILPKTRIIFASPLSATRKLPRLNSEPNGGGFDKEYDGGYGTKVSEIYEINSIRNFVQQIACKHSFKRKQKPRWLIVALGTHLTI